MKSLSVLAVSGALMFALAGPATATGDWQKRLCDYLRDRLNETLVAYESTGPDDHRHEYLKHRYRTLEHRIRYYCAIYHDDDPTSPAHNKTGYEWEQTWAALHDD
ncbi:MAG: hypothetical protein QNJ13_08635 [Paracoccaceae bacterium]|nr:hypothetical protein [Paracoccaceae bacterium]